MDALKKKLKKNVLGKALHRSKSNAHKPEEETTTTTTTPTKHFSKSKSWPILRSNGYDKPPCPPSPSPSPSTNKPHDRRRRRRVPEGCFPVHVGPEQKRYVVSTKHANHPLFVMLLEDAEVEYGYASQGPLVLPCDEDLFCKVLAEMESDRTDDEILRAAGGCGMGAVGYSPLATPRLLKMNVLQH